MADLISSEKLGRRPGQRKLDLLLVGDATRYFLTVSVQRFFSSLAHATLTICNVKKAAMLLVTKSFDIIFLKVASTLTAEELEIVKSVRERIKFCCEQLRTLLPYVKGRKSDVASVIEATVDYVKYVRDTISPAIMAQVSQALLQRALLRIFIKHESPAQGSLLIPSMLSDIVLGLSLPMMLLPEQIRTFPSIYHPLCPVSPTFSLSTAILCFAKHAQPLPIVWPGFWMYHMNLDMA
ncbi:spermatogeneis- and oogenesis-specific basic helix-loop-helix-containing protein 2 [Cricetulus griseus]|uniref:Spermatogeneis-and oogenesis-specific basic helix-loop-helix-containing protein 2 n=1 Tax=Cricetulus griseus TaxID=10029 RepID=A0A061IR97_CRIGR|nr:spermatogeneis- and oogenesis-specific basic helix-loop-helix-containing protein 2 [Cricetulus griseus]